MRVGFVGLGTMGAPMARNLLRAGHEVTVHNRTRDKEKPLQAEGARRATTPAEVATAAEVVCTIVSDTPDVEAILFGPHGVAEGAAPGAVVVDLSTIAPDAARSFAERLGSRDIGFVDAPVSGGSEGAERGSLTIMCGGEADDIEAVRPVLEAMGSTITHVGPSGAGQATKAVNQVIVGGTYMAVAEGIVLGLKQGLDMDAVLNAISGGACSSWVLENRAPNMLADDYPLGFRLALHLKDLRIALATAEGAGAELPLARMLADLEETLVQSGRGDDDVSVVASELRRRAGLSSA